MISLVIHGGAGTLLQSEISAGQESAYRLALEQALQSGYSILQKGGTALDAVEAAVIAMEDNALFNAGRGSVFTHEGKHEMDAAIMDGKSRAAGAVAGVTLVKRPIALARAVMEKSGHVLLCGNGALEFAKQQNIQLENEDYFYSSFRHAQWMAVKDQEAYQLDHNIKPGAGNKFGTVGAVARDGYGHLAAATSTGGMTNKRFGRVGDSALIGCGTWADDSTCAISCTGHGELFIRAVAAYDVHCLMAYKGMNLRPAMEEVTLKKLVAMGGEGGMVGVDAMGNAAMVFNSEGMYRGRKNEAGTEISIYK